MSRPRLRPVFVRPMAGAPSRFLDALRQALDRSSGQPGECRGKVFANGAILRLCDAECRVWSPALHLAVEGRGDGDGGGSTGNGGDGWQLHGTFSPSSPVWTAFVAIYLGLACVGIGTACWGGAQLIMNETPWAFVGVPITLALAAFTYGAAFIGQGLGAEDMYALRSFVDHVVDHVVASGGDAHPDANRNARGDVANA